MKHLTQLTVLVVAILILVLFGIVFYLYVSIIDRETVSEQLEESTIEIVSDQTQEYQVEIRNRLEAVSPISTEYNPEESEEIIMRLDAVRGAELELSPKDQAAREANIKEKLSALPESNN